MSSVFRLLTTSLLLWTFMSLSLSSSASLINDQPDFAVDLNVTNFDVVLKDAPAPFAIVQFFAHWSPASRNYKPQYEKVARLFNGPNAVHPGIILMTRIDCAMRINTDLCDKFSISHYPSLFWGPTSKFVGGSWNRENEKSEIRPIEDGRTSDRLLKWINTQLESSYKLEEEKYENDDLHLNVSKHGQILNVTQFDVVLKDAPAPFTIVQFFAHWSPACRKYTPQYEKVARLFNGPNAVHPGIIIMTRIDCGMRVNTDICDKFSISHYPSLFWGPTSKFVGGSWNRENEKSEIRLIEDGRTSDRLLKWINTQLESSYKLEDEKYENDDVLHFNVSNLGQVVKSSL